MLAERDLGLAGGYLELPYADHDALEQASPELDELLATFDAVAAVPGRPAAAADAGRRRQHAAAEPARPVRRRSPPSASTPAGGGGSPRAWPGWSGRCRDRGYEPTFHPETGTYVEAPWEIERVLDRSDIGLCLETGHMLIGGGDPVAAARGLGRPRSTTCT